MAIGNSTDETTTRVLFQKVELDWIPYKHPDNKSKQQQKTHCPKLIYGIQRLYQCLSLTQN